MKLTLLMFALALAGLSSSCRVEAPLDPDTIQPSRKFCPEYYTDDHPSSCGTCYNEVIVSSK